MSRLFEALLINPVLATLLAVLVFLIGFGKPRPALLHALWVVVLLRLLMPPMFEVTIPWLRFEPSASPNAAAVPWQASGELAQVPTLSNDNSTSLPSFATGAVDAALEQPEPQLQEVPPPAQPADGVSTPPPAIESSNPSKPFEPGTGIVYWTLLSKWLFHRWAMLAIVWLSGSCTWLGIAVVRTVTMLGEIRRAQPVPARVQLLIDQQSKIVGLRRRPKSVAVDWNMSPAVWPFSPYLLLPAGLVHDLSDEEMSLLIAHELVHLHRRDHWVRLLELLATVTY